MPVVYTNSPVTEEIYETLPVAVVVLNKENTILYANQVACKVLGYRKSALVNKVFLQFLVKDDIGAFKIARENTAAKNAHQTADLRLFKANGEIAFFRMEFSAGGSLIVLTDITYKKKIENTQAFLLGNGWKAKGQDFFHALAEYLADILHADYICIHKLRGNLEAKTEVVYFDGRFEDNITYALHGTPAGKVLSSNLCSYPQSVKLLFPQDQFLQQIDAEGYTGITLRDAKNVPIGLIAVISRKPVADIRTSEMILKQVSIRAAAELEHRLAEKRFASLTKSSQAMLSSTDEKEMMRKVCDIVTNDCGYAMMWIGMARDDEHKSIEPVASAGFEEGYLETLKLTWSDTERGRGPTGIAVRTGTISICNNLITDPDFKPWRPEAIKRGYAASIAIPLKSGNKTFGALMIYAREEGFFTPDEVKHLAELAKDLSVGITSIRLAAENRKALMELERFKVNKG